jgi:hypothetical protein
MTDTTGHRWYRGDFHMHSARSNGGELTPEQLVTAAREAGLDFFAITEHNTAGTHDAWGLLAGDAANADAANADAAAGTGAVSGPLVILGQEVVTRTGHWLALGLRRGQVIKADYGVRDGMIGRYTEQVRRAGGLCVAAHPHAPYPGGVFMYPFDGFDVVEAWNGPWTSDVPWQADNESALAEWGRSLGAGVRDGCWRPAIGNSDTHLAGQAGVPHTVVLAEELSAAALLAGIRSGRCWIAGSAAVELSLEARAGEHRAGIGDRLDTGGEPTAIRVEISGVPSGTVTIHTDRGTVHRESLPAAGPGAVEWKTTAAESAFVRVEVRHPSGSAAAITNPVIVA